MTSRSFKMVLNVLCSVTAVFAFLLLPPTPVRCQSSTTRTSTPTSDSARTRITSEGEREAEMDSLTATHPNKTDPKHLSAAQAQIQEDFTHIVSLHNQIANVATGQASIDYHSISDAAAEIRKRASRVQQTLALTKLAGTQQTQTKKLKYEDAQIKLALVALCQGIRSFVTNPVIENPGTADAMQLAKAREELSGVIELSGRIKKSADRLSKSTPELKR
jgi:hypothetical protein